jgi:hypothetical protein
MLNKKENLKCYEKVLNGIIAVNIGAASIPIEKLSLWESFLNDWECFQKDNKNDISKMIRQFGRDEGNSLKHRRKRKSEGRCEHDRGI